MTEPSLEDLEARRARLYEQLAATEDFRRGSVSENYRRCGKPSCHCAQPGDRGHGPRYLWTRTVPGGRGSTGRQLSPGEVDKVRRELSNYRRFAEVSERIVEVNEAICEARPPDTAAAAPPASTEAEKRGLFDQLASEATAEVEHLAAQTARTLSSSGEGLETAELAIRTAMLQLGADLLEKLLGVDLGHRGPRIDCGQGHSAEFVSYRTKEIDTVLGRITLRRAYYHCRACEHGVVPRDDELDVTGASLSPGLRRMTARAAAAEPFAPAAGLLAELAGVSLTAKRVERSAEADGATAATVIQAESTAIVDRQISVLPPAQLPDKLYLAVDGTGVPVVPAATQDRAGKGPDGKARTREVKLACLFTQTRVDPDGRPVRDPDSTSYLGTFAPAGEFATLVHAEARRRGADHIRQLVVLGDGAHWIWNLATAILPEATQIVDLYHAREHLHDLAKLLAPALADQPAWLTERLADLDKGHIETLVHTAEQVPLAAPETIADRDTALGYFKTNAQRMRYAYFRSLGMFVGSGAVEAGCKAVVGQRLKLSGMRWNIPGATGILTLRCHQASDRWEHIWTRPHNQIPTALTA